MKLAFKLVSVLVLAVLAMLSLEAYIGVQKENAAFESDLRRDAERLGVALRVVIAGMPQPGAPGPTAELLRDVGAVEKNLSVNWIRLDREAPPTDALTASLEDLNRLRHGKVRHLRYERPDAGGALVTYVPVQLDGRWEAALELRQPLSVIVKRADAALLRTGVLTLAVAAVGVLLIIVLGIRWIGTPLRTLAAHAGQVAAGDLSARVALDTKDELADLAAEYNRMCEQLSDARAHAELEMEAREAAVEQLRHEDRLKTVGRLAAGVAHELGTPLNVVLGHATLIGRGGLSAEDTKDSAQIVQKEVRHITRIVQQLLDFTRRRPPEKQVTDLAVVAGAMVSMLEPIAEKLGGTLSFVEPIEPILALVDASQIEQVLNNLLVNGLQAGPDDVHVAVSIQVEEAEPAKDHPGERGRYARIDVRDDGAGIGEQAAERLFEPFFTTKQPGEGTGLGLSIADGLVREHGGWIAVESAPDQGTCFSVFLPLGEDT